MKTLLVAVNAKYIHSNPAIYNLRAYCREYKDTIELAEYTINHYTEDILMDIYKKKPEFIGFSCYIWNIGMIRELGRELRKLLPEVPVWLGGPEVSYDSALFLEEESWATGIMAGEGEETFYELMKYYQSGVGLLENIKGIVYRMPYPPASRNGALNRIQTNPSRQVMDLSCVPFIYEDMTIFEHKIVYYESSRGCPFSCSYCLSSIDKRVRFRDLKLVKQELKFFLEQKVPQVKFVDRTFNCRKSHAMAIWTFIKENDNGITNFHFEIAADLIDDEEIQLLASMRPGLVQLEIGVQTVNPDTLKAIRRKTDLEKLESIVSKIREGGNVHQHLDLIAGLPFEDFASFQRSFDRVYAMKPDQLQLGFLKVLKGSYMHEMAQEYGLVYKEQPPYEVLYTKWISFDEMIHLKSVEKMVEMYYNSDQFGHTLEYFVEKYDSAFEFYSRLAEFYEAKNLQMMSHARITRYEVLLEFLMDSMKKNNRQDKYKSEQPREKVQPQQEVRSQEKVQPQAEAQLQQEAQKLWEKEKQRIKELLTLDLYAREKVKSRPSWAKDLTLYKERFRAFYAREAEERQYLKEYEGCNARQLANMTHIEIFTCIHGKETAVLFNYAVRNPKNKEAKMEIIELVRESYGSDCKKNKRDFTITG